MLREGNKIPETFKPIIMVVDGDRIPLTGEDVEQIHKNHEKVRNLEIELAWTRKRASLPLSFVTQFKDCEYKFYFIADENHRDYDRERAELELKLLLLAGDNILLHSGLAITLDGTEFLITEDIDEGITETKEKTLYDVFDYLEDFWDRMTELKSRLDREVSKLFDSKLFKGGDE